MWQEFAVGPPGHGRVVGDVHGGEVDRCLVIGREDCQENIFMNEFGTKEVWKVVARCLICVATQCNERHCAMCCSPSEENARRFRAYALPRTIEAFVSLSPRRCLPVCETYRTHREWAKVLRMENGNGPSVVRVGGVACGEAWQVERMVMRLPFLARALNATFIPSRQAAPFQQ